MTLEFLLCKDCDEEVEVKIDADNPIMCPECRPLETCPQCEPSEISPYRGPYI